MQEFKGTMLNPNPRIFIVGGWWKEPQHLVDDWYESFSWADKICIVDDRKNKVWGDEGKYRLKQRAKLEKAGIKPWDWVFVTSPDERLEVGAEAVMREEIQKDLGLRTYSFDLKELFTPLQYRTDGIWGRKTRPRLYPYLPNQIFHTRKIQQTPVPLTRINQRYKRLKLDLNIYHLKMIEPENRQTRIDDYTAADPQGRLVNKNSPSIKRLDPEGKFAKHGWNYLKDTEGMILERIPRGRGYRPKYKPYSLRKIS